MPAAKLTLDFDTRKFSDANNAVITAFTGKNGSIREFELSIVQLGVPLNLPEGTTLEVALKRTADPPGTTLTEAEAHQVGWGSGSRWSYKIDLHSYALPS
jgi:hypothetical protein